MWTNLNWHDYEILAASSGEKLERWGDYLLIRPDPQVIWKTAKTHPGWKKPNAHYHRSKEGGGEWEFFDLPEEWSISYHGLVFRLKPFSFKHTGIFPEQAVNWDWCAEKIRLRTKILKRPLKVLNLFAYTGGATISAAKAGASVTHVDAAKGMLSWAKENAVASGLNAKPIRWLVDDCIKFAEREIRRGSTYDGIIMDPPSYGRGPKGEVWKMEENIFAFIELAAQLLTKEASFFLVNSYTTGLQPSVLSYMLNTVLVPRFGGHVKAAEIGLPVTENGLILPCGASGRWEAIE
ncbi:MAG: class I SAM-dependent methyltransferase [Lachnospiraceae bacterium]|nr:class I SAM-dependent methyltransferase [Lachnospiraceae bacterium]